MVSIEKETSTVFPIAQIFGNSVPFPMFKHADVGLSFLSMVALHPSLPNPKWPNRVERTRDQSRDDYIYSIEQRQSAEGKLC